MTGNGLARTGPEPQPVTVGLGTLKYLGYDPDNVATQALVALAKRYQLDPLLGEIQLISDSKGRRVYITRDGMLEIAHRSGRLDGIVVDEERRSTGDDGWTAYVSVYVKGMAHPFRYGAQCKDKEPQAQRGNGPEMALTRAERRALKRAFRIRSDYYPEHPEHGSENDDEPDPAVEPNRMVDPDPALEIVGEGTAGPQERQPVQPALAPSVERPLTDTPDVATFTDTSASVAEPTPAAASVAEEPVEFVVPTQDQWTEMRGQIHARGYRGRPGPRHQEFTRILNRPVTDDNQLSRADCERVLAHWRLEDNDGQFQ